MLRHPSKVSRRFTLFSRRLKSLDGWPSMLAGKAIVKIFSLVALMDDLAAMSGAEPQWVLAGGVDNCPVLNGVLYRCAVLVRMLPQQYGEFLK